MVRAGSGSIGDLIIEVRSATAGVGSFTFKLITWRVTGKTADQIIAAGRAAGDRSPPGAPWEWGRGGRTSILIP